MSVRVLVGDAGAALATLEAESVDCCITSPPYFGLRDYGVDGQIGREPTLGAYIEALVAVMRQVRRVLRPQGVVFLNLGDCYAGGGRGGKRAERGGVTGKQASNAASLGAGDASCPPECKPKDLMLVPARMAIALQDDGWWVRSEIIWAKPNPMPESVTSRPSTAHEHIWMLTKSGKHYYNNGEGQEPVSESTVQRGISAVKALERGFENRPHKYAEEAGGQRRIGEKRRDTAAYNADVAKYAPRTWAFGKAGNGRNDEQRAYTPPLHRNHDSNTGFHERWQKQLREQAARPPIADITRSLATRPKDGKALSNEPHKFAPERADLAERTYMARIEAAERSVQIGTRRLRNYEEAPLEVWRFCPASYREAHFATFPPTLVERCLAIGCPEGGTVLDPFGGAGTTGLVADRLGYDAILCELNPAYADLAVERIRQESPLTADVTAEPVQEALL